MAVQDNEASKIMSRRIALADVSPGDHVYLRHPVNVHGIVVQDNNGGNLSVLAPKLKEYCGPMPLIDFAKRGTLCRAGYGCGTAASFQWHGVAQKFLRASGDVVCARALKSFHEIEVDATREVDDVSWCISCMAFLPDGSLVSANHKQAYVFVEDDVLVAYVQSQLAAQRVTLYEFIWGTRDFNVDDISMPQQISEVLHNQILADGYSMSGAHDDFDTQESADRGLEVDSDPTDGSRRTLPRKQINGTFRNPPSWRFEERNLFHVAQWKLENLTGNRNAPSFPSEAEALAKLPRVAVDMDILHGNGGKVQLADGSGTVELAPGAPPRGGVLVTWIGHSTFLVQSHGVNVLTDPVWSARASPVQFAGPLRMVPVPLQLHELPPIHLVTISHNHYDHLDTASITTLAKVFNPIFVVPLGMKSWFASQNLKLERVVELDWWEHCDLDCLQEVFVVVTHSDAKARRGCVRVTGVPAKHWSMRTGFDRYRELWCGFVVEIASREGNERRKIYHAGDTGFCPVFKEIGKEFQQIDVSLIPIGAYEPRWVMEPQHVSPEESVSIHEDVRSKYSIGMHWGTFILTDEPIDDPPKKLHESLRKRGQLTAPHEGNQFVEDMSTLCARFRTMPCGETLLYSDALLDDTV